MKIGIGNDHVAVEYKNVIREYIEAKYTASFWSETV